MMFYTKSEIAKGVTIRTEINYENVFAACSDCGVETQVDLCDAVEEDGFLNLLSAPILCPSCMKNHLPLKEQDGDRALNFDKWEPDGRDYRRLLAYFRSYYEGTRDNCGADDDQTIEALALYNKVKKMPLKCVKDDIQEHFADMFHCVNGCPEAYYDAETCNLIELTVCPDPLED